MSPLPAHVGDQGELWFAACLPRGWLWQPPRKDLGKDALIVIRDGSELHNHEFSVQIKTSEHPKVRKNHILLSGVSRQSVQYWFTGPLPTLVVAVDITSHAAWFAWHFDLFESPDQVFGNTSATVTIRIPETNRLDDTGWNAIRRDLRRHFTILRRALSNDYIMPVLMRTLYTVSRISSNLTRISAHPTPELPPTHAQGMLLLIEQVELRDLIAGVRLFLDKLAPEVEMHKQILFWLESFETTACRAHPTIKNLPPPGNPIPADLAIGFAPKLLVDTRQQLILAALDLAMLLTGPANRQPPPESA